MDVSPVVSVGTNGYTSYINTRLERSTSAMANVQDVLARLEGQRAVKAAVELRDRAEALRVSILRTNPLQTSGAGGVVGSAVTLDPSTTAANLASTAEINLDPTAFTPRRPLWNATSTSQASLAGSYDGSLGSTSLTVTVINPGVREASNARVEVTDNASPYAERFNIHRNDPLDEVYTLSIGIELTFGVGSFDSGDTFNVTLQTGPDVKPNPTGAFDGSTGTDANLEASLDVTAGSFTVNGELIAVAANDSIDSVLNQINASAAGVIASYDAITEAISLVQQTPGAAPSIVVANDTSGFLAATKLDSAIVMPGTDPERDRPLADVPSLTGISSGNFLINGVEISLDTSNDSVTAAIEAINSANAGVTAELLDDAYLIIRRIGSSALDLDSNGTGFFEAFGITSGTIETQTALSGPSEVSLYEISRQTRRLVAGVNNLLNAPAYAPPSEEFESLRDQLTAFVRNDLAKPLATLGFNVGIRIDDTGRLPATVSPLNASELRRGFRWQFAETASLFVGSPHSGKDGALESLLELLDQTVLAPRQPGSLINQFA